MKKLLSFVLLCSISPLVACGFGGKFGEEFCALDAQVSDLPLAVKTPSPVTTPRTQRKKIEDRLSALLAQIREMMPVDKTRVQDFLKNIVNEKERALITQILTTASLKD